MLRANVTLNFSEVGSVERPGCGCSPQCDAKWCPEGFDSQWQPLNCWPGTCVVVYVIIASYHKWLWQTLNTTMIMALGERPTRGAHPVDYITCRFVRIIDFTLLPLTRHNCLTQDFTNMSDTCKGCEKRSIFALKRHQRAEQAWHQRIPAQLCLSELGSPWPTSPLYDCEESFMNGCNSTSYACWWHTGVRVSGGEVSPTCRGPWHSFRTKAWPAVDTHSQNCGWLARPRLCLPWNWKLQGPFLMTNHCPYIFSSPWRTTFWWCFVVDIATNFH